MTQTVGAVVVMALAVPMILGWVPRNPIYGVRTRRTMASDEAWYPANRVGGYVVFVAGLAWLGVLLLRT